MSDSQSIRVVIVDDHPMVREGLKAFLSTQDDIEVVGAASDGASGVDLCTELHPDVVLMDVIMPGMGGETATRLIRKECPQTQVVALTSFVEDSLVRETLDAGAISYLLKDAEPERLAQAIREARDGRGTIDSSAVGAIMKRDDDLGHDLTPREREVLNLLATGMSNNDIAERLTLSVATVRLHVSNILGKLRAPNRTTAVVMALEHGLLEARDAG